MPGDEEDAEEPAEDGSPARSHRSGRSEPLSTWIASKLTPNRLSKVDSPPSQLEFREMRDRTVVTAKGKLVRRPISSSGNPDCSIKFRCPPGSDRCCTG